MRDFKSSLLYPHVWEHSQGYNSDCIIVYTYSLETKKK